MKLYRPENSATLPALFAALALTLAGAPACSDDGGGEGAGGDGNALPQPVTDPTPLAGTPGTQPANSGTTGTGDPAATTGDSSQAGSDSQMDSGGSAGDQAATGGGGGSDTAVEPDPAVADLEPFSFFVTSLEIMRELSGSQDGFGGDLGGLSGADGICQEAAARVGFGAKTWRAFLSATDDGTGNPVHAIDRIGEGPWYDRNGLLVAENKAGLLQDRPAGDPATINDLPNEFGEGLKSMGDTHDVLTGTNAQGMLDSTDPANTCNDWTSTTAEPTSSGPFGGDLRVGHAWPSMLSGTNWIAVHGERSCAPGVNLVQDGPGDGSSVGAGGGWGAIYCFALQP